MAVVKMYKEDSECTADRVQVSLMEKAGWSLTKEEPKVEEVEVEAEEPKVEAKVEAKPKAKAAPKKRRSTKKAE